MQKEIFFTPEEMQIIRVCLHNAPIPYDQGEGAKELKALQEKVGPPISREEEGEVLENVIWSSINEQCRIRSCLLDNTSTLSFNKIRSV